MRTLSRLIQQRLMKAEKRRGKECCKMIADCSEVSRADEKPCSTHPILLSCFFSIFTNLHFSTCSNKFNSHTPDDIQSAFSLPSPAAAARCLGLHRNKTRKKKGKTVQLEVVTVRKLSRKLNLIKTRILFSLAGDDFECHKLTISIFRDVSPSNELEGRL